MVKTLTIPRFSLLTEASYNISKVLQFEALLLKSTDTWVDALSAAATYLIPNKRKCAEQRHSVNFGLVDLALPASDLGETIRSLLKGIPDIPGGKRGSWFPEHPFSYEDGGGDDRWSTPETPFLRPSHTSFSERRPNANFMSPESECRSGSICFHSISPGNGRENLSILRKGRGEGINDSGCF